MNLACEHHRTYCGCIWVIFASPSIEPYFCENISVTLSRFYSHLNLHCTGTGTYCKKRLVASFFESNCTKMFIRGSWRSCSGSYVDGPDFVVSVVSWQSLLRQKLDNSLSRTNADAIRPFNFTDNFTRFGITNSYCEFAFETQLFLGISSAEIVGRCPTHFN